EIDAGQGPSGAIVGDQRVQLVPPRNLVVESADGWHRDRRHPDAGLGGPLVHRSEIAHDLRRLAVPAQIVGSAEDDHPGRPLTHHVALEALDHLRRQLSTDSADLDLRAIPEPLRQEAAVGRLLVVGTFSGRRLKPGGKAVAEAHDEGEKWGWLATGVNWFSY